MSNIRMIALFLITMMASVCAADPSPVDFLRITELNYHPQNPTAAEAALGGHATDDTKYEFVELTNIGVEPLNVSGVTFTAGITYTFPAATIIPAGGRVVLVNDLPSFRARYGNDIAVFAVNTGSFSNSSEIVTLKTSGAVTILSFTYLDTWFPNTDGPGYTLRVINPAAPVAGWNVGPASLDPLTNWQQSTSIHGSPGYADGAASGIPSFNPPAGVFTVDFSLALTATAADSVIYYTVDGTVPTIASPVYSSPIPITATTEVRAFVKGINIPAGAVVSAHYVKGAEPVVDALRVTELHYNPAAPSVDEIAAGGDGVDNNKYEFVELTNIGAVSLDISGVAFTAGITYTFPSSTVIPAGGRIVLVNNSASFVARYGDEISIFGQYSGDFKNSSEAVTVVSALGTVIQTFTYADSWLPTTDGGGYSMGVVNPAGDLAAWSTAAGWQASGAVHGSPGYADGIVSGLPHFSVEAGTFYIDFNLALTADAIDSTIYFTTDGSTPTTASSVYTTPIAITGTTTVKAFVKGAGIPRGSTVTALYIKDIEATVQYLRVTEINYHPANPTAAEAALGGEPIDDTKYEYVELMNIGANPLNVKSVAFTQGITYQFPSTDMMIPAGGRIYLASNAASFQARYGVDVVPAGIYTGSFSNSTEATRLVTALGTTIQFFTYVDAWYPTTDGGGYSLQVVSPTQNLSLWSDPSGWRASDIVNGSPAYTSGIPHFSRASGIFNETFDLTITADAPDSIIRYTINGTVPTDVSPIYTGPLSLSATTQVRAFVKATNKAKGQVMSAYYIKLAADASNFVTHMPVVLVETFGAPVPDSSLASTSQIVGDLTILPAPAVGTATTLGERTPELVTRVGVREHGSTSRYFLKQSLALEGWDENNGDIDFAPMGMPSGEDWALVGPYHYDSSFIRNAVAYELYAQLGHYAPRFRMVEVFSNHNGGDLAAADYQGVYMFVEKIKRGADRIDVEKLEAVDTLPPAVEGGYIFKVDRADPDDTGITIAAGTPQQQVVQLVYPDIDIIAPEQKTWLTDHLNEFIVALQAPDFINPTTLKPYSDYINTDSWIDHHIMMVLFQDADGLAFSNFMYKSRTGEIFHAPIWDLDRSSDSKDARTANPFAMYGLTIGTNISTRYFEYPWYDRLFANPDFVQRYTDRIKKLLTNTLAVSNLHEVIDQFATPLNQVILPETNSPARRDELKYPLPGVIIPQLSNGLRHTDAPRSFTQADVTLTGYIAEVTRLKAWLQNRVEFLSGQWLDAPIFSHAGGTVDPGYQLIVSSPVGSIYYTLDDTDPRANGGEPSASATLYTGPITVTDPVIVRARVRDGSRWSPQAKGTYLIASAMSLRITELMYNPKPDADPLLVDAQNYEFIELKNVSGTESIDLTGITIADGVDFVFTGGTLAPKAVVLLVADQLAFEARYGVGKPIAGVYTGRLNNVGEQIRILAADTTEILKFSYSDLWYPSTNGQGPSLVINNPYGSKADWNIAEGWRESYNLTGGTPGEDENQTPTATGEEFTIAVNQALPMTVAALTVNDIDADIFDDLSVKRVANPASLGSAYANTKGTVSIGIGTAAGPGATITYTPPTNFYGTDYFSYVAMDLLQAESNIVTVKITVSTPLIRINEFYTHTDSPNSDGVEIYNPTDFPINISGWRLSKTPTGAGNSYNFPTTTIIQPKSLMLITMDASDNDGNVTILGLWHTEFSPKSGAVYLLPKVDGVLKTPISGTTFPVSLDGDSFIYWMTSDGRIVYPIARPKTVNKVNGAPKIGPIVITEIMYAPEVGEHQFIEIQNTSTSTVRLDKSFEVLGETKTFGWRIEGAAFSFAPGFSLTGGQMCVIVDGNISADEFRLQKNIPPSVPIFNFSGSLKLTGTRISLQQAENFDAQPALYWLTNDLVDFKNAGYWPSIAAGSGRSIIRKSKTAYGDDPINWTTSQDVGGSPGTSEGASPPTSSNDSYTLNPGAELIVPAVGILGNDSDPNRDAITAVLKTDVANGVLTLNSNGSFRYVPTLGFVGIDSFTYQAKDVTGLFSGVATVALNVGRSQLDASIRNATDDGEEHEDGIMDLSSTDIELVYDAKIDGGQPRGNQWIGVRFERLAIPAGAKITNAWVQFTSTSEVPANDACSLNFYANDVDNALTFLDAPLNISTRLRTSAVVNWSPEPWLIAQESTDKQRSPNLASVVQQIVSRPGWAPNNAMALLIHGSGKRVAEALDGAKPELCARFHVEWTLGGPYGNPDSYTAVQNQTLSVPAAIGVLVNDGTLGENPVITAQVIVPPANGSLILNSDGSFDYTPIANLTGPDQFIYRVTDGVVSSADVTVSLKVTAPSTDYSPGLDYQFWWTRLSSVNEIPALPSPIKTGTVASFDIAPRDVDDNFAFKYSGFIHLPTMGTYTFYLKSDEGSALWLDGVLLVNNDGIHSNSTERSGTVNITVTGRHAIEVRYFERDGSQSLLASYAGPSINKQTIPAAVLSHETTDRVKALDDAYSVAINGTVTVLAANGVLKNDVSVIGTPITAVLVTPPTLGTLTGSLAANGSFIFIANPGVEGYDSFTYRCTDGVNVSNLATVKVTVGSPDAAQPTAQPDMYTTNAGKNLVVGIAEGLLKNDTDPNGELLKSYFVTLPDINQGSLLGNKVEVDGRFTFVPKAGFIGTATFTYKCNDGVFDSDPKTVTIEVLPPSPLDEYARLRTANFDAIGKDLSGITWNADTNTYFAICNDTSTVDGRKVQIFEYLPDLTTLIRTIKIIQDDAVAPFEDKTGYDSEDIMYLGNGDFAIGYEGHKDGIPTQYLENRVCIVHIDSATTQVNTNVGQCVRIILPQVSFDNNGLEGLTYDRNGNGGLGVFYGTQEKNPITIWRFNRPADRVTIADYDALTQCALTVPFDAVALLESKFIISDLSGIMFDDRTGRLLLVTDEGQALVDIDTNGRVIGQIYMPTSLEGGADQYEGITLGKDYHIVTVSEPNIFTEFYNFTLPSADDDTYSMPDNTTLTIAATSGVLANDTDGNGETLTAQLVTPPVVGTLTLGSAGNFTFAPPSGFSGTVTFVYKAFDGHYLSQPATVTIGISSIDHPPVALPNNYTLAEDSTFDSNVASVASNIRSVLFNDSDPDGDAKFAVVAVRPLHGVLSMKANGTFTYKPAANFHGSDSFTYRCRAGSAESAPALVSLTITPVNDAPVAVPESMLVIAEDATLTLTAPGVLINDYDVDGDAITAEAVVPPLHGTLTVATDGSLIYQPVANYNGPDNFQYRCKDAILGSLPVTVSITVTPTNDAPGAADDVASIDEDTVLSLSAPGVLVNDIDMDGDSVIVGEILTQPTHGTLDLAINGALTYTPNTDWNGVDSFTYASFDSVLMSAPATVTITVNVVDDAPRPTNDSYWTRVNRDLTVPVAQGVLANDVEVDAEVMTVVVKTNPAHGTLTLAADGSFLFVPETDYIGSDSFEYTVTSGIFSVDASVALLIKPLDIAPMVDAIIPAQSPVTGTTVGLTVSASDADNDPAPLTYTWSATGPGAVVFAANGSTSANSTVATFTMAGDYHLTVVVSDGELSVQSELDLPVLQIPQNFSVAPTAMIIANGLTKTITPSSFDQFGAAMNPMPTINWSVVSGIVSVNANGGVIAPVSGVGPAVVHAQMGTFGADVAVTVIVPATGVGITGVDYQAAESVVTDTATFRIYRAAVQTTALPVTIVWSGSATAGVDYAALPTLVTIPANTSSVTLTISTINDNEVEGREYVIGTLVPDANFTIAKLTDQIEIIDDEKPLIGAGIVDATGTENGTDGITLKLVRYPVNPAVSVTVMPDFSAGTATYGTDFTVAAASYTFSGVTSTINIPIIRMNDSDVEGTETVIMTVPAGTTYDNGALTATAKLGDDEMPEVTLAVNDAVLIEPSDVGLMTVTRWPVGTQPVTVNYALSGTTSLLAPMIGSVDIPANATSATITLSASDDAVVEVTGTATLTLTTGVYQTPGVKAGNVTVTDDDARLADLLVTTRLGVDYRQYVYSALDTWTGLQDLTTLTPVASGSMTTPLLTPVTQTDRFAFQYTGFISIPTEGLWTLFTKSDEGSKLWIGNTLVVNNDGVHTALEKSGQLRLKAGKHPFRLDYFDQTGTQSLAISWQGPGVTKAAIPAAKWFRANAAPTAVADSYTVIGGTQLVIAANGVLANDSDIDGHPITASLVSAPATGTLVLNADGSLTFDAPLTPGFITFTYSASDTLDLSTPATVTIKVNPATPPLLTVNAGSGDGSYEQNAVVTITADAPASGMMFDQWTGDVGNVANVALENTTITMPFGDVTVTASYKVAPAVPLPIIEETFSYTGTNLIGKNGGTGWSGAWTMVRGKGAPYNDNTLKSTALLDYPGLTETGIQAKWWTGTGSSPQSMVRSFQAPLIDNNKTYWMAFELQSSAQKSRAGLWLNGYATTSLVSMYSSNGAAPSYYFLDDTSTAANNTTMLLGSTAATNLFVFKITLSGTTGVADDAVAVYVNPILTTEPATWTPKYTRLINLSTGISGITLASNVNAATWSIAQFDEFRIASTAKGAVGFGNNAPSDIQAPTAPTNVAAATQSNSSILVSWTASTDDTGVVNYDVFNGVALAGTVSGTSLLVNGLLPSTSYSFTVKAKDAANNASTEGGPASAMTDADTQAPTVPMNVVAVAQSSSSVLVSWTVSTDDVGVLGYDIYNGAVLAGTTASTSFLVNGLAASTMYSFTVIAKDGANNISLAGGPADATTSAPVILQALVVNNGSGDGNYAAGAVVAISADAAPAGKVFDAWIGDVAYVANPVNASTNVTMPTALVTVTATYKDAPATAPALVIETFDYTGTSVVGKNGGTGWSGPWVMNKAKGTPYNDNTLVAGSIMNYEVLAESGNYMNWWTATGTNPQYLTRNFTNAITDDGSTYWLAFEMQSPAQKINSGLWLSGYTPTALITLASTNGGAPSYTLLDGKSLSNPSSASFLFVIKIVTNTGTSVDDVVTAYVNPDLTQDPSNWLVKATTTINLHVAVTGLTFTSNVNAANWSSAKFDEFRLATTVNGALGLSSGPAVPTGVADNYLINSINPFSGSSVLANDIGAVTAELLTSTTHGTLSLVNDGTFTYTPNPSYVGVDTFTYRAVKSGLNSASTTVTLNVLTTSRLAKLGIGIGSTVSGLPLSQNLSGITRTADGTYFAIQNNPTNIAELSADLSTVVRLISITGHPDTEDICYLGQDALNQPRFALVGETHISGGVITDPNLIAIVSIPPAATTVSVASGDCVRFILPPAAISNFGLEGICFNAALNRLYVVQEKSGVKVLSIDLPSDISTPAEFDYTGTGFTELFTIESSLGSLVTDLASVSFDATTERLIFLSQESARLVELNLDGSVVFTFDLPAGHQYEGLTLLPDGSALIVGEPMEYLPLPKISGLG